MDFVQKGMKELPLKNIIMEAGRNLGMYIQWSKKMDWVNQQAEYFHQANCLIEIAEVMVCGSVGGFDAVKVGNKTISQDIRGEEFFPDRRWSERGKYDPLFERWLWLFTFYVQRHERITSATIAADDRTLLGGSGWYKVGDLKRFFARRKD